MKNNEKIFTKGTVYVKPVSLFEDLEKYGSMFYNPYKEPVHFKHDGQSKVISKNFII